MTAFIKMILFLSFCYVISPQEFDTRGNVNGSQLKNYFEITLNSDKLRYWENENIYFSIKIKNIGLETITFYTKKDLLQNYQLILKNNQGKVLPVINKQEIQPMSMNFNSNIIYLKPQSSIEQTLKLQDFYNLDFTHLPLQHLNLKIYFYPEGLSASNNYVKSKNILHFYIDKQEKLTYNNSITSYEKVEPMISQKETVYLALTAEYTHNWIHFFKYFFLESFIKSYPNFSIEYLHSDEKNKYHVVERFKKFLMHNENKKLIQFKILKEEQNSPETGYVYSQVQRRIDGFIRKFKYKYFLTKLNDIWKITGLEATLTK